MSHCRYETEVRVAVPLKISSQDAVRHIGALLNAAELVETGAIPGFVNGLTFENQVNGYKLNVCLTSGNSDGSDSNWLQPIQDLVDSRQTATGFEQVQIW